MEALDHEGSDFTDVLARGLVDRFGGASGDYKVARASPPRMAVFFPNWVARESAIARSPLRLENRSFRFSNWVEAGELGRGRMLHKAWIKLHHWPIACWHKDDVLAAVSSFGALWEMDADCEALKEVAFLRANIRCRNFRDIPRELHLFVEDRSFVIPVELESWEETNPILLGEDMVRHLGLETAEDQDVFIRSSGFADFKVGGAAGNSRLQSRDGVPGETSQSPSEMGLARPERLPDRDTKAFLNPLVSSATQRSETGSRIGSDPVRGEVTHVLRSGTPDPVSNLLCSPFCADGPSGLPGSSPPLSDLIWPPLGPRPSPLVDLGPSSSAKPSSCLGPAPASPALSGGPASLISLGPDVTVSCSPSQAGELARVVPRALPPSLGKRNSLRRSNRLASK